jgi:hypothetical protein
MMPLGAIERERSYGGNAGFDSRCKSRSKRRAEEGKIRMAITPKLRSGAAV